MCERQSLYVISYVTSPIYKYKYKYKYVIDTNTVTIIGKGPKWSYSSCLWIENTIIWHYYEYWIISFLRVRQLLM